jgi:predicted exporter
VADRRAGRRRRADLWLIAAPVGAAALTLATLGLFGVTANLFNVLALLLVLGMGVDYSVFMREGAQAGTGSRATVVMAILLAGLMTLLSFGMLAFSATPFIRSIGLTVLLGVTFTFVLALVCAPRAAR